MPDLADGESTEMQGSGAKPYTIKNVGGVYSCSCPAWRNQSVAIERRTCKHIRKLRGDAAEEARLASILPARKPTVDEEGGADGPPILLAESWDNELDLAGWWMSEKLDGVRAYWDGKQFLSRQGNRFFAPDWFVEGLPDIPLDGELWIARKTFQRTVGIVKRQDKPDIWREVRYLVFDAPAVTGDFETRIEFVKEHVARKKPPFTLAHTHELCRSIDHLRAELARVEGLGGEGLMMRQPRSRYETGRSSCLLKVKRFHDAEARVVGHLPGAGKHKGRLGALQVELPNGIQFAVGTGFTDAQRGAPPSVGTTITFRFQELTEAGVPRFPSFVAVRTDVKLQTPSTATGPVPKAVKAAPKAGGIAGVVGSTTAARAEPPKPAEPVFADGKAYYFEFIQGDSAKFWEVTVKGSEVTTAWGKIGTDGRSTTKAFADRGAAVKYAAKMVGEKKAEGYVEA
jgi:DNA ligase 1